MKDKLIKTGKTKPYYILKTTLIVLGFLFLALLIFAIPIGIEYSLH